MRKEGGGYRGPRAQYAISLGCDIAHAREMLYADGLDLKNRDAIVPVGPSCRLCVAPTVSNGAPAVAMHGCIRKPPDKREDASQ